MDAIFFLARPRQVSGVASRHDLPSDVAAADPLCCEDPSPVLSLAEVLGIDARMTPTRHATCCSFPIWDLGPELAHRIAGLDSSEIEDAAERWLKHCETSLDANRAELESCLEDLRAAIRDKAPDEHLFVLLEERAW